MKRTVLLLFVITAISSILYAQQNDKGLHEGELIHNGFLKASQYLEFDGNSQRVYAMGLLDGMYMSPAFGAPASNKLLLEIETCVEGMKSSQVAAIIEKYVKDHPEKWNWDLKDTGYNAMLDGCRNR
jgi:hypothetical protein